MNVSRETQLGLSIYQKLLEKWNSSINLVASGDMEWLQTRHLQDCLQLSDIAPQNVGHWLDLGSGGGLPGLVVALARADQKTRFTLVESDKRKAAFLRQVVRETGLAHVAVLAQRIEAVPPMNADLVSARALAPLPRLMPYLERHLSPEGRALLPKGKQWQEEVDEARRTWTFSCTVHPSKTQKEAAVLEISGVSHGTS